jgi:predicted Zn-dependent protease
MLASEVLTQVRLLLNDDTAPYRWTDTILLGFLDMAMVEVFKRRPDAMLELTTFATTPPTVTATTTDLILGTGWLGALTHYVCFRAFSLDSEAVGNAALAGGHLKLFAQEIS